MTDALTIRPLTPDHAGDFVTLFGPSGACYGCWCTYFRLPPKLRGDLTGDEKRAHMLARIAAGPPPGLLAWDAEGPVGWMQIGPRADVPQWNNPRRSSTPLPDAPADDPGVWAISCFFIRSKARGHGLSHALVAAGVDWARENGARVLEASPMDQAKQSKSIGLFVGSTAVFEKAGFATVARQKPNRPLMRLVL
ncbi:MAG: GNAT family N-acetyltransferase [Rhodobacter sp.]|nr:GNAT family N-acetyltransferase [Paracoccaceae bacterium]MCC0076681.1 GNAT family N-acetyltransferase [Rhodobacter sp.]